MHIHTAHIQRPGARVYTRNCDAKTARSRDKSLRRRYHRPYIRRIYIFLSFPRFPCVYVHRTPIYVHTYITRVQPRVHFRAHACVGGGGDASSERCERVRSANCSIRGLSGRLTSAQCDFQPLDTRVCVCVYRKEKIGAFQLCIVEDGAGRLSGCRNFPTNARRPGRVNNG